LCVGRTQLFSKSQPNTDAGSGQQDMKQKKPRDKPTAEQQKGEFQAWMTVVRGYM
jgi:hypothetical protein